MTAQDTYLSQREDEVAALRREVSRLRDENADLKRKLDKKSLKVHGFPVHPGQMSIGGTEEK